MTLTTPVGHAPLRSTRTLLAHGRRGRNTSLRTLARHPVALPNIGPIIDACERGRGEGGGARGREKEEGQGEGRRGSNRANVR